LRVCEEVGLRERVVGKRWSESEVQGVKRGGGKGRTAPA
jgi:hypothetical protein